MSRAVKANNIVTNIGKTNLIIIGVLVLAIGFVTGILFVLNIGKDDIDKNMTFAYQCESGDVLYLGDLTCGDVYGNDTYAPIKVEFNESDYLDSNAAFNVYDVIPLLLESDKPDTLKDYDKFYIVKDTTFVVESSVEVKNINDFMQKITNDLLVIFILFNKKTRIIPS